MHVRSDILSYVIIQKIHVFIPTKNIDLSGDHHLKGVRDISSRPCNFLVHRVDLRVGRVKDKPAVQIDLAKSEQSPNLNNNNSSINLIDTPTPREINKMPLDDNQQPISSSINDFDLKIINLSPAKQPSTPQPKEHLPSNRRKGVSTSANRISPPKSKLTTKKTKNDQHNLAPKSSTFCPFLKRNGRCLKGNRCDFLHPKRSPARKHQTLCPFLQKRGFCLKGDTCDFSHIKLHTPENTLKTNV